MTIMLNVSMNENIDIIISMQFFSLLAWLTTRGTSQNCEYRHHHQYHHISSVTFIIIVMALGEDHQIACFKNSMTKKQRTAMSYISRSKQATLV